MWERFVQGLQANVTWKQAAAIIGLCLFIAGAFAFGAFMGARSVRPAPMPMTPGQMFSQGMGMPPPPMRGTFGAIDQVNGNTIQLRDPRTGRTWVVRAGRNTIVQMGPRQQIQFSNLRVGQRVFVVGVPDAGQTPNEFDAQFIGVVLGQPQRYEQRAQPTRCKNCTD